MASIYKLKPILKNMLPAPVRRAVKKVVLKRVNAQIGRAEILPYEPGRYPRGINLIGPIDSATGLGQSFRLVERVFSGLDSPYLIYNFAQNTRNKVQISEYEDKIQSKLKYSINLWHVNPSDFAEAYAELGQSAFDGRYNIAFWLWELEDFPDEWVPYIRLLDEVWTPSEFISEAVRKKTDKPVHTVPYSVTAQADTGRYGRAFFNLPEDKFLFLMMYDLQSITERKNPEGAIRAFRTAFPATREDVGLVIKVNSADERALRVIYQQTENAPNIYFVKQNLERIQVNSLIACADVFVSLHRAEGFGLVLAEAMLNHVPTIATNWSANTEFMSPQTACMVDYRLKNLEKDIYPYKRGCRWAEPDLADAAAYMKRLADDCGYYQEIAEQGYRSICEKLSLDKIRAIVKDRLAEIDGKR